MLNKIFPKQADNTYRGHPIARWAFMFLTIKTIFASLVHMFASDGGAQSIASITLDSFTTGGANTVITIFGLWGLSQLMMGLVNAIVLWRYQALIPLMYVVFVFEYAMRMASRFYTPGVVSVNTPPGAILDYVLLPLAIIMLVLAIKERKS